MHGEGEAHEPDAAAAEGSRDEWAQCEHVEKEVDKAAKPQQVEQQQEEESPAAAADGDQSKVEEVGDLERLPSSTLFEIPIEKTEQGGFGIYFTKRESASGSPCLVVDGFVENPSQDESMPADEDATSPATESDCKKDGIRELLHLGDILVGVNGADCLRMEVMEIVALLRAASLGSNTLQFSRECPQLERYLENNDRSDATAKKEEASASITKSFIGALRKVKTKIREGIEGDEELLAREQEEKALFEKTWLAEFDRLKHEYETKWETCTYTADEFCGLLYHSGDPQQKEYLLREYPLLMDAWENVNLSAASLRVRPDWPAPRVSYAAVIEYRHSLAVLSEATGAEDLASDRNERQPSPPQVREIRLSPALYRVLDALRHDFTWRRNDVHAVAKQLETAEIVSCSDLVQALEARGGAHFENAFQSAEFPRLTKAICRSLHAHARHAAKSHEDVNGMPDLKQLKKEVVGS
ncbi:hypothetical protein Gpo141_00001412 [Globisporangium polare]